MKIGAAIRAARQGTTGRLAVVLPAGPGRDHRGSRPGPGTWGNGRPGGYAGWVAVTRAGWPIRFSRAFTLCSRGNRMSW